MLLKIVYGTGRNVYITDVKRVSFIAHHAEHAYPLDLDKVVDWNGFVAYSDEYLTGQIGCSPSGEDDNKYFMNEIHVTTSDPEPQIIYFTGVAYLCDDTGKTVDTLR